MGFLDSFTSQDRIWYNDFWWFPARTTYNFMYQLRELPLKVVIILVLNIASSWTCRTIHTTSHKKQCCLGSSNISPLNIGNNMFPLNMLCTWGTREFELNVPLVRNIWPLSWLLLVLWFDKMHFKILLGLASHARYVHGLVGISYSWLWYGYRTSSPSSEISQYSFYSSQYSS